MKDIDQFCEYPRLDVVPPKRGTKREVIMRYGHILAGRVKEFREENFTETEIRKIRDSVVAKIAHLRLRRSPIIINDVLDEVIEDLRLEGFAA